MQQWRIRVDVYAECLIANILISHGCMDGRSAAVLFSRRDFGLRASQGPTDFTGLDEMPVDLFSCLLSSWILVTGLGRGGCLCNSVP